MITKNLSGKTKAGLLRDGKRVYIILEFPDEYLAMQAYDVWSMDDIDIHFKGPKYCIEKDAQKVD